MLLNRPEIRQSIADFRERRKKIVQDEENIIHDIQNSDGYKALMQKYPGSFTFNFNTDGAQLFNSSKKRLWPLQLHLNELSPEDRFKHLIIGILMQTEHEPSVELLNLFMSEMVEESKQLSTKGV